MTGVQTCALPISFSDEEVEELAGRCCAVTASGKRCPNAALPGTRYCGIPAHQALVGQEPPAAPEETATAEEAESAATEESESGVPESGEAQATSGS